MHSDLVRFLYVTTIPDVYTRRIVGSAVEPYFPTALLEQARKGANPHRDPQDVVYHADHGWTYTRHGFGKHVREAKVNPSIGWVGNAKDNAVAGSAFATLKREDLNGRRLPSQAEADMNTFGCFDAKCDPR